MPVEFVVLHLKQSTTDMKTFFSFFFIVGVVYSIWTVFRKIYLLLPDGEGTFAGCADHLVWHLPGQAALTLSFFLWEFIIQLYEGGWDLKKRYVFFPILKITLSNVLRSVHVHTRGSRLDVFSLLEERLDFSKFEQSFIVGAEVKDGAMTDLGWHHCRILHHTWSMKTDKSTVKVVFRIY